jgi:hypothetical protein
VAIRIVEVVGLLKVITVVELAVCGAPMEVV